ncbi:MAG: hypothetical protein U5R49_07895 [Deltaproteobacteria bacterium]|nr:hypothetical protein [Deltaproteobacteria bacterium]
MMELTELKRNRGLVDAIDWNMGPEEAVRLYLEWGNNWSRGYQMVRSKDDESYYFVLNTWDEDPVVYFIRRSSEGAVELARVDLPEQLREKIRQTHGKNKGVFAVENEIRDWLKEQLDAN